MTITLPVVLVMRNVEWPSHRTSICCAAARPAYAQSTTAMAAIALTLLLAKMDMTPPSGLACDGTTLLPCLAQPRAATPIDDSISLTPARVLAGSEVCEGAA